MAHLNFTSALAMKGLWLAIVILASASAQAQSTVELINLGTRYELKSGSYLHTADSAIYFLEKAYKASLKGQDTVNLYRSSFYLAQYYGYAKLDHRSAMKYSERAVESASLLDDPDKVCNALLLKSNLLRHTGYFNEASICNDLAREWALKTTNPDQLIFQITLAQISTIVDHWDEVRIRQLFKVARELLPKVKLDNEYKARYLLAASLRWALEDQDSSLHYIIKAEYYGRESKDDYLLSTILTNISALLKIKGKTDSALKVYKEIHRLQLDQNPEIRASYLSILAMNFWNSGILPSQLQDYHLAKDAFIGLQNISRLPYAYTALALFHEKNNQGDSARFYRQLSKRITDSLGQSDKQALLEKSLLLLRAYGLSNELDREKLLAQGLRIKNNMLTIIIPGLVLLTLLLIIWYFRGQRKKINHLLAMINALHGEKSSNPLNGYEPNFQFNRSSLAAKLILQVSKIEDISALSVESLSHMAHLSPRQLRRKIRTETGLNPGAIIQELKLARARQLIIEGKCSSLKELAITLGFNDSSYLSNIFKDRFGIRPTDLMAQQGHLP